MRPMPGMIGFIASNSSTKVTTTPVKSFVDIIILCSFFKLLSNKFL